MTGNPALNQNTFIDVQSTRDGNAMTIQGTVNKTSILLLLLVVAAAFTWRMYFTGAGTALLPWTYGGAIAGFVIGLVTIFKKEWSPVTSPLYAICEGLFIGGISSILDARFPGIVLQAVMLTFGTLAALLGAYKNGLIVASDKFKRGIIAATGGIMLVYVATIILGFFHVQVPFIYGSSPMSIGFSIVVVIVAALNLGRWVERNRTAAEFLTQQFDHDLIVHNAESSERIARWAYSQGAATHALAWVRNREFQTIDESCMDLLS